MLWEDPTDAAALANTWSESVVSELERALFHSWRVTQLQSDFYDLGCIFAAEVYDGEPAGVWVCQHEDEALDPDRLVKELIEEVQLSRGILPALSFSVLAEAAPPEAPVLWERGTLIIASTVVGLIVGVIFSLTRPVMSEARGIKHQLSPDANMAFAVQVNKKAFVKLTNVVKASRSVYASNRSQVLLVWTSLPGLTFKISDNGTPVSTDA